MISYRSLNNARRLSTRTVSVVGAILALSLTFTTVASARRLTTSEIQIIQKLPAGKALGSTATAEDVLSAAQAALNVPQSSYLPNVTPATLVATADLYAPKYAAALARAGLVRLQSFVFATPILTFRQTRAQTYTIVAASMRVTLLGGVNKADRAAAVTASVVDTLRNSSLLPLAVQSAVATAQNFGGTSVTTNGAAGAVTGAISQVAGSGNGNISDNATSADALVVTVITSAVAAAPAKLAVIAEAAGYAFAGTYRATNGLNNATIFLNDNLQGLLTAVLNGLAPRLKFNANVRQAVSDQITAGISLAYSGYQIAGAKGVSPGGVQFAANNGNPVTDTTGL